MEFWKLQKGDFLTIASIVVPNSMMVLTSGRHISTLRRVFPFVFTPVYFYRSSLSSRNAVFLLRNPSSKTVPLFRRFRRLRFVWSGSRMWESDIIPGALSNGTIKRDTDRAFHPIYVRKIDFLSVLRCFSKSVYRPRLSFLTDLETYDHPSKSPKTLQDLWKLGKRGQIPVNRHFVSTDILRDKGYAILIDRSAFIRNPRGVLEFRSRVRNSSLKVPAPIETNMGWCDNEVESLEVWNVKCYSQWYGSRV